MEARIRLKTPFVILAFGSFVAFLGGPLVVAVLVLVLAPVHVGIPVALVGLARNRARNSGERYAGG
jgi:hypothetical protein